MAMARAEGTISSKIAKVWMSGQCSPVVNVLRELQLVACVSEIPVCSALTQRSKGFR